MIERNKFNFLEKILNSLKHMEMRISKEGLETPINKKEKNSDLSKNELRFNEGFP